MDVFISWSGERSRAAAEALRGWLPKIINAIKPWLSSADIDKGARWSTDVASRLEAAKAGIICLTPSNIHSDWILFEAGALSKTLQNTFVCPFLIGLEPSDVKPPLAQFQATKAEKDEVLKLLKTLNSALGDDALPETHINEAFEVWWPRLESQLKNLPSEDSKTKPHRPDRELLEEILSVVRNQNRAPDATDVLSFQDLSPMLRSREAHLRRAHAIIAAISHALNDRNFEVHSTRGPINVKGMEIYHFRTEQGIFSVTVPLAFDVREAIAFIESHLDKWQPGSEREGPKSKEAES
jgi:hypothetical protein